MPAVAWCFGFSAIKKCQRLLNGEISSKKKMALSEIDVKPVFVSLRTHSRYSITFFEYERFDRKLRCKGKRKVITLMNK